MAEGDDKPKAKKLPQYLAGVSVCMGAAAAGAVLSWTANITNGLKEGELNDFKMTDSQLGGVGLSVTFGALIMCVPIGVLCDFLGRKLTLLAVAVPFMGGWVVILFANGPWILYIGRFFTGLSLGAFCVAAPLYTSEIAEVEIRGTLGTFFQLFLTCGILFANVTGMICSIKVHTMCCLILPVIFVILFLLQPETPVYHLKKNKEEAAKKALKKFRGKDFDVDMELQYLKAAMESDREAKLSVFTAIKEKQHIRAMVIVFGQMFFQQLSGINAVIFYTNAIFKAAGTNLDPAIATVIVGVFQVIATVVSSVLVEKAGRKILLLASAICMALSTFMLGIFFSLVERELVDEDTAKTIGFIPIIALVIFIIMFSMGFGPVPWLMASEVFHPGVRSVLSSANGVISWGLACFVTGFYLDVKNAIGGDLTFYMFTLFSILGSVFVFFFVFETKGRTNEEIQARLKGDADF